MCVGLCIRKIKSFSYKWTCGEIRCHCLTVPSPPPTHEHSKASPEGPVPHQHSLTVLSTHSANSQSQERLPQTELWEDILQTSLVLQLPQLEMIDRSLGEKERHVCGPTESSKVTLKLWGAVFTKTQQELGGGGNPDSSLSLLFLLKRFPPSTKSQSGLKPHC